MKQVLLLLPLMLVGCAKTTTTPPTAPTPPQITVSNAVAAFASATDAASHALVAAQANGTISPADFGTAKAVLTAAANAGIKIDAELRSTDTWCTTSVLIAGCQQAAVLSILQGAGLSALYAHISTNAQVVVAGVLTAANAVSAAFGGPTL